MIVNRYPVGQGITDHVDLLQFEDGIVGLSLLSPCFMDLKSLKDPSHQIEVLLRPGDLYIMWGKARYEYTHGIAGRNKDLWEGKILERSERISVTLRKILPQ